MGNLTINDFRGAMGKYNLGSLILEGEGANQKIALVNNHNWFRSIRNVTPSDAKANEAIREQFAAAIEAYLKSKGFDLSADSAAGKFFAAIREELLGGDARKADLRRNEDVARILDKIDAAVELKEFDLSKHEKLTLADRFVFTVDTGANSSEKASVSDQTLAAAKGMLQVDEKGRLKADEKLLSMAMRAANISKTRATTYLTTRPETILVKAEKYLRKAVEKFSEGELKQMMENVGKANFARLAIAKAIEELHSETISAKGLSGFAGVQRQTSNMIMGLDSFDAVRLSQKGELNGLLSALSSIASGNETQCKVKIMGQTVTLAKNDAGGLDATMGNVRFAAFGDAKVVLRNIENAITNGGMDIGDLKSVYQNKSYMMDIEDAEGRRRCRTIASAIIAKTAKLGEIELQALTSKSAGRIADSIIAGNLKTADEVKEAIKQESSATMYSESTLAMLERYQNASEAERNRAVIAEPRTDTTPPVNKFVSDLFSNSDVWVMDNNDKAGRIKTTLQDHADTLVSMLEKGDKSLDTLPGIEGIGVKDAVKSILTQLRENGVKDAETLKSFLGNEGSRNILGAIADAIDNAAEQAIDRIQTAFRTRMSDNDGNVNQNKRELWEMSLEDVISEQKKSADSVEGKFIKKLFGEYMVRSKIQEKRSMVASLTRLANSGSSDVQKFAAVLKGAGPVFQKLLQGFPDDQIPVSMRGVFADMKSNLAPIPDTVVKASFARIIEDSGNRISSISLDKTLGSASVGQAFLCTINNTDGNSFKAVIKMLKPDVQNRFAREVDLLRKMAEEVDGDVAGGELKNGANGMLETLNGRIDTIKDELNFNVEAENVKNGQIYNKNSRTVKSVELYKGVASDMNMLVLSLAEGDTVDNYLSRRVDSELKSIKAGLTFRPAYFGQSEAYDAQDFGTLQKTRMKLFDLADEVAKKQSYLIDLSKQWLGEAIFETGFFHGDMHAGNIMVSDKGVTMIDFGNAMKLSADEQNALKLLVCSAAANKPESFLEGMDKLLGDSSSGVKLKDEEFRKEICDYLDNVFRKGSMNDTDAKLLVALNALQDRGVKIPSAVYNYASSQNRLKNAIDEMGAKLDEIKYVIANTKLDGEFVYEAREKGGGMRSAYTNATKIANLIPAFKCVSEIVNNGFSEMAGKELLKCKASLTPENRQGVVDILMADNGEKIKSVLEPAVALFETFGEANENLGTRLKDAEMALSGAQTEADKRDAVAKLVGVLHEIQLEIIAGVERSDKLPVRQSLGGAFSDVIEEKVRNSNIMDKLVLLSQVGGNKITDALAANLSREHVLSVKESRIDNGEYVNKSSRFMGVWNKADLPTYKAYAHDMRFSPATSKHLASGDVVFSKDAVVRQNLVKELADNLKKIYVKEACQLRSPMTQIRLTHQTSATQYNFDNKWRDGMINRDMKNLVEAIETSPREAEIPTVDTLLAYVCLHMNVVDSPSRFNILANELHQDSDFVITLANEMAGSFKLDDEDVKAIADATFDFHAKMSGKDPRNLNDEQKTKLHAEIEKLVRDDFAKEAPAYRVRLVSTIEEAAFAVRKDNNKILASMDKVDELES